MEDVVEQMRRDVGVQTVRGDAFRVAYVSESPITAMRVAERLAGLFIDENLKDREQLAQGTSQFLASQLEDARQLSFTTRKNRLATVTGGPRGSDETCARSAGTSRQGIARNTAVALGGVWRHRWSWPARWHGRRDLGAIRLGIRDESRPEAKVERIAPRLGERLRRRRRCSWPSCSGTGRSGRGRCLAITSHWRRRSSVTGR